jgi:hypothetical protein
LQHIEAGADDIYVEGPKLMEIGEVFKLDEHNGAGQKKRHDSTRRPCM